MLSLDEISWTYQLEDGQCKDSMALATAKYCGIDTEVLKQAAQLQKEFDSHCRPSLFNPSAGSLYLNSTPDEPDEEGADKEDDMKAVGDLAEKGGDAKISSSAISSIGPTQCPMN